MEENHEILVLVFPVEFRTLVKKFYRLSTIVIHDQYHSPSLYSIKVQEFHEMNQLNTDCLTLFNIHMASMCEELLNESDLNFLYDIFIPIHFSP